MFQLGQDRLTSDMLVSLASKPNPSLSVPEAVWKKVDSARKVVDDIVASGRTVYGINTGFGFLSDVAIAPENLDQLQVNLIRSHACGVGEHSDDEIVRGLLVLRAHTFCLAQSGVTRELVESVLTFLQHDILPVIPCKGSVGASGDLAPLAHLALGLMGEGRVRYKGELKEAGEVLKTLGITPYSPRAKEGLSLINGTHYMTVLAAHAVEKSSTLIRSADCILGLSLDAIKGTTRAFLPEVQQARGQQGQFDVADNINYLFSEPDPIMESHTDCGKVQDPYSFRCAPQVHGAARDCLGFVREKVDIELNAVTDNPIIINGDDIVSGGNFHGEPIAMVMDFLAIAVAEIGSISERRIEKLTNPALSGLPAFITKDSGLNSGYMIPHVVAAALVSENKVLCHPASVDSIPTSADKEDHVSMGPISAHKVLKILTNVCSVLAIEALASSQAIDLHGPLLPGPMLLDLYKKVRELSPSMEVDRSLSDDFEVIANWIQGGGVLSAVRNSQSMIK